MKRREQARENSATARPRAELGCSIQVPTACDYVEVAAPVAGELGRAIVRDVRIVVGGDDRRRERQRLARQRREITERVVALDIRRCDQQRGANRPPPTLRPVRGRDAAERMRDHGRWYRVRRDRFIDRGDPGFASRIAPIDHRDPRRAQLVLPRRLPMVRSRACPAGYDQISLRVDKHP